jgi:hypothetical protein
MCRRRMSAAFTRIDAPANPIAMSIAKCVSNAWSDAASSHVLEIYVPCPVSSTGQKEEGVLSDQVANIVLFVTATMLAALPPCTPPIAT